MNPNAVKQLVVFALCCVAAVLAGSILASQTYDNLILLAYLLLGIYVFAAPGIVPLIAFGLVNPFVLPIPFIYSFPFIFLILGICCVKLFFRNALTRESSPPYRHCFTRGFLLFFAWLGLRYCLHPVLPNFAGFGAAVTGFRSYLNYGICFVLILLLPLFLSTRQDVVKLLRWIGGISLFFIVFFIPLVFSKSLVASFWLQRFGLFVSAFDNGWLRFVVLPGFGINVLMLSFFPRLMPLAKGLRFAIGFLGVAAIIIGGNRGSFVMAFVMVLAIVLLHRGVQMFGMLVVGTSLLLIGFHLIGEQLDVRGGVGFLRVMSLTSRRIAEESGASGTVDWRMIRWKRAVEEIRAHPILGKGYGGLESAWLFADWTQAEEASVEIDLASGGIHNGYLTCAYSLGLPAVLFFLITLMGQIMRNFRDSRLLRSDDPLAGELHSIILANLVGLIILIYVGTDLNSPAIWLYLTLGVSLTRLLKPELAPARIPAPNPIRSPSLRHSSVR